MALRLTRSTVASMASRETPSSWRNSYGLIYACAVAAAPSIRGVVCASTRASAMRTVAFAPPPFSTRGLHQHRRKRQGFAKYFSSSHHTGPCSVSLPKGSHSFFTKGGTARSMGSRNQKSSRGNQKGGDDVGETSEGLSDNDDDDDDENDPFKIAVENETLQWIKRVVIGLNLCPFAEKPLREEKLKISVVLGEDDETVVAAVLYEMIVRTSDAHPGTTVVVAPNYHPDDFYKYISLVQFLEDDIMEKYDMHGVVQVAPFHPLFEFQGSGEGGVDNFTNRSPYPMFHILREEEVSSAVAKLGGDASKVWERNVKLMEAMNKKWGKDKFLKAMAGEHLVDLDDFLREAKIIEIQDAEKR